MKNYDSHTTTEHDYTLHIIFYYYIIIFSHITMGREER